MSNMQRNNIDTSSISDMLLMGDVDFSKSETEKEGCRTYWIDFKPEDKKHFSAEFENCDSTVTVLQVMPL